MNGIFLASICTIIQIPSLMLRFFPFKNCVSKKQKYILGSIYLVSFVVNFMLWWLSIERGFLSITFYKYSLMGFSLLMTGANILVISGRFREHLFTSGTEFLLGQIIIIVVDFGNQFINSIELSERITLHALSVLILYLVCFSFFRKLLVETVSPFLELETGNYWRMVWLIPFSIYIANTIANPQDFSATTYYQLAAQFFLTVATVLVCKSMTTDALRIREKIEFSEQIGRQKEYYIALSDKVAEMRRFKHDSKHHIDAMRHFVNSGDREALYKYCSVLLKNTNEDMDVPYSGNSAVDGLIYRYNELAQKQNISFNVSSNLSDIEIDDVDICVLIGNALDNAFVGCLTTKGERFVSLFARKESGALTIMVQNSFDGIVNKKENQILSRKRKDEAGIGLSSMEAICRKYGGEMEIRWEDNVFSVMFYNL